jgi:hypothetical protein
VQPGNPTRCHTTELRSLAARRCRDHALPCMPLVRPILRDVVAPSALQLMQSFIVDSVVVVVARLLTARRLTRHRSGETEETPVPYHQLIGWEEVWRAMDSAPLGSSLRDRSASTTARLRVLAAIPGETSFASPPNWRTLSMKPHWCNFGRRHLSARRTCTSAWSTD